jgi:FeS assembly protein IscX
MVLKWLDVTNIAIELEDLYPDKDNVNLRYTDLKNWVCQLDGFDDNPDGCNEKILEAIQMAWIEERS